MTAARYTPLHHAHSRFSRSDPLFASQTLDPSAEPRYMTSAFTLLHQAVRSAADQALSAASRTTRIIIPDHEPWIVLDALRGDGHAVYVFAPGMDDSPGAQGCSADSHMLSGLDIPVLWAGARVAQRAEGN